MALAEAVVELRPIKQSEIVRPTIPEIRDCLAQRGFNPQTLSLDPKIFTGGMTNKEIQNFYLRYSRALDLNKGDIHVPNPKRLETDNTHYELIPGCAISFVMNDQGFSMGRRSPNAKHQPKINDTFIDVSTYVKKGSVGKIDTVSQEHIALVDIRGYALLYIAGRNGAVVNGDELSEGSLVSFPKKRGLMVTIPRRHRLANCYANLLITRSAEDLITIARVPDPQNFPSVTSFRPAVEVNLAQ